jgi:tetratricopeptide (TPR) repeat protein
MKRFIKIIMFLLLPVLAMSKPEDQLKNRNSNLSIEDNDTIKMDVYLNKALHFNEINPDSSLFYLEIGLPIAQKLNLKLFEAQFLENRGYMLTTIGNYPKALESFMASLKIAENPESEKYTWNLPDGQSPRKARLTKLGYLHLTMGHLYGRTNNIEKQISSYKQFLVIADLLQDSGMKGLANMNLGRAYIDQNKLDSALLFEQNALLQQEGKYKGVVLNYIGKIYEAKGEYNLALDAYRKAINHSQKENNLAGYTGNALSLSSLFLELNEQDSSLYYSRKAVETSNITKGYWDTSYGYKLISDVFRNPPKPNLSNPKRWPALGNSLPASPMRSRTR